MEATQEADTVDTQWGCGHCGEKAALSCGQCKNMRYCSLECQQADWCFHSLLCKSYVQNMRNGRLFPDRRLAIYFPAAKGPPYYSWIAIEDGTQTASHALDEDSVPHATRELAEKLGVPVRDDTVGTTLPRSDTFCGKARRDDEPTSRTVRLTCGKEGRGEFLDYSVYAAIGAPGPVNNTPNACLAGIAGKDVGSHYRCNIMIYGMTKVLDSNTVVDVDTRGLTLAIDALVKRTLLGEMLQKKVKGVKVNVSAPYLQELDIPSHHKLFEKGKAIQVTDKIGAPLLTYKYPA